MHNLDECGHTSVLPTYNDKLFKNLYKSLFV